MRQQSTIALSGLFVFKSWNPFIKNMDMYLFKNKFTSYTSLYILFWLQRCYNFFFINILM